MIATNAKIAVCAECGANLISTSFTNGPMRDWICPDCRKTSQLSDYRDQAVASLAPIAPVKTTERIALFE